MPPCQAAAWRRMQASRPHHKQGQPEHRKGKSSRSRSGRDLLVATAAVVAVAEGVLHPPPAHTRRPRILPSSTPPAGSKARRAGEGGGRLTATPLVGPRKSPRPDQSKTTPAQRPGLEVEADPQHHRPGSARRGDSERAEEQLGGCGRGGRREAEGRPERGMGGLQPPADPGTQISASRPVKTKTPAQRPALKSKDWSGRGDLNSGPPEPHSGALPGCATSRRRFLL